MINTLILGSLGKYAIVKFAILPRIGENLAIFYEPHPQIKKIIHVLDMSLLPSGYNEIIHLLNLKEKVDAILLVD